MAKKFALKELRDTLESLPVFVVMDFLYAKNKASPIAIDKSTSQKYGELVRMFDTTMRAGAARTSVEGPRELPFTTLFSIAEMILYSLVKEEDMLVQVMAPEYRCAYLPSHSMNTAFLSSRVGISMKLSFRELTELCVAALLHDIGMTRIHPSYYEHDRVLSESEREVVETHPELGHKFLECLEKDFPWLLRVIREEHLRRNNQGSPADMEEEPHLYTRIVSVCDSFEALTHHRSFRKAYHPGDAIKIIIDGKTTHYDKEVLRAMIEAISIFPVGSLVQLNTNTIAEVIRSIEGSPLRPVVRMVETEKTEHGVESRVVDLSQEKSLFIAGLVYDERYYIPDQAKSL